MGTLVTAQNPPDGWITSPATAWGTYFKLDTAQVLQGASSILVPSYGAFAGSVQLIGPPVPLSIYSQAQFSGTRYAPRAFVYTGGASLKLGIDFNMYQTVSLDSQVNNVNLQSVATSLPNNSVWFHRTGSIAVASGAAWGRFIFTLNSAGQASSLWIGGVELARIKPGAIIQQGTINITGGAAFTSVPWSLPFFTDGEVDIVTPGQGGAVANSGILLKNSGWWTITAEFTAPATLATGTTVQCKIIEGETGGPGSLAASIQSAVVTQPGGGGVAQTLRFSWIIDGYGTGKDYATSLNAAATSGFPYIIQLSHNDGVNVRNFGVATLRAIYHG